MFICFLEQNKFDRKENTFISFLFYNKETKTYSNFLFIVFQMVVQEENNMLNKKQYVKGFPSINVDNPWEYYKKYFKKTL